MLQLTPACFTRQYTFWAPNYHSKPQSWQPQPPVVRRGSVSAVVERPRVSKWLAESHGWAGHPARGQTQLTGGTGDPGRDAVGHRARMARGKPPLPPDKTPGWTWETGPSPDKTPGWPGSRPPQPNCRGVQGKPSRRAPVHPGDQGKPSRRAPVHPGDQGKPSRRGGQNITKHGF